MDLSPYCSNDCTHRECLLWRIIEELGNRAMQRTDEASTSQPSEARQSPYPPPQTPPPTGFTDNEAVSGGSPFRPFGCAFEECIHPFCGDASGC
jgi:hypothetical protein